MICDGYLSQDVARRQVRHCFCRWCAPDGGTPLQSSLSLRVQGTRLGPGLKHATDLIVPACTRAFGFNGCLAMLSLPRTLVRTVNGFVPSIMPPAGLLA